MRTTKQPMILSMTGYGEGKGSYKNKSITVEIKSLNGKTTDIRFKSPANYRQKELELRKFITSHAKRGKFDVTISFDAASAAEEFGLNKALFKKYWSELSLLKKELKFGDEGVVAAILRIPNVVQSEDGSISDAEWKIIKKTTQAALDSLHKFRAEDGKGMMKDLRKNVKSIQKCLKGVKPFEKERITMLKARMEKNLSDYLGKQNVDKNRYEQEVIFYLEKLDINEEKVRLEQHCKFFLEQLESTSVDAKGKKLAFIGQEMGREINTLGAKAQHSKIQKLVVTMKDELERIKEQVANIV